MSSVDIEKKLVELESIVKDLESGSLNLDDSLKRFERGVSLYQECKQGLSTVEKQIKVLTDKLKEEDIDQV